MKKICIASIMVLSIFALASCGKKKTTNKTTKNNTVSTTKCNTTSKQTTTKGNTLDVVIEGNIKYVITKDAKGNDISIYSYYNDGNDYIHYARIYREYDSNNRITASIAYTYNNSKKKYDGASGYVKSYDEKGRVKGLSEVRYDSEKDEAYIAFYDVYEYDSQDRVIKTTVERCDGAGQDFYDWSINTITYDDHSKTTLRSICSSGTYNDTFLETETYDDKNRLIIDETYMFGEKYSINEYEYNDGSRTVMETRSFADKDHNYIPRERSVYTENMEKPTRIVRYGYDDNFYLDEEYTITYGEYGRMEYIVKQWDSTESEFKNYQKAILVTDRYDMYAYKALYTWNGTDWVLGE